MEILRLHSCDMIVSDGTCILEWVLMIEAGSYSEVAAIAERYVFEHRPGSAINEMDIQAQEVVDNSVPSIRFAGEPREISLAAQDVTHPFFRWLDVLRGKAT
ncbi:MAG TPA: hypothetical protein VGJ26_14125 [Pirellulales bacterium]|jgi:hypothetical protein